MSAHIWGKKPDAQGAGASSRERELTSDGDEEDGDDYGDHDDNDDDDGRVAKCHRYGRYICVKILEGWGKKCGRPHTFVN